MHWPADHVVAEKSIIVRKDRRVSHVMKPAQGLAAFLRKTCRINRHQVPEDRRVRRQRGRLFQYVLKRQIIEPRERHPLLKRFELSTYLL